MHIDVEEAYRRYGPMVLRRCRRLLRVDSQAEDAMHDVFIQLLRHRSRMDGRGMSALLYRIATNVCLNRLRSRGRRPEDPEGELLARIAAIDPSLESRTGARAVIGRLFGHESGSSATIAVLHHIDGMTLEEVADTVGMSVSGVRKRLRKLQVEIRDLVEVPS